MNVTTNTLKTFKVRIKDKHASVLKQWAFECNQVWNEANAITAEYGYVPVPEVGYISIHFSAFDLAKSQASFKKSRGFTLKRTVPKLVRVAAVFPSTVRKVEQACE